MRQVLGGNARAGVANRDARSGRRCPGGERQLAVLRRVAQRVGGKILERLFEALSVGPDRQVGRLDIDFERDVAFANQRSMAIGDAAEQLPNRHVLASQRAASALEAREVEQIADEGFELLRLVADDVQVTAARRRIRA